MKKTAESNGIDYTAVIMEIDEGTSMGESKDPFEKIIRELTERVGYQVTKSLALPYDASAIKRKVANLIDEEQAGLIFVRNRSWYSLNEELFDLEDRELRETRSWKRIWSRQRILYNDVNHAITVVRGDSLIMNFEGDFTSVSEELVEILEMWKENCILYKKENDTQNSN